MVQERKSLYAHEEDAGVVTRGLYGGVRIFLTGLYFGILIPMLNELVLCVLSWCRAGGLPNSTEFISAVFMVVLSPIAFGYVVFVAGLVFGILAGLFKSRTVACLVAPVVCVVLTLVFMKQYVYVENDMAYYLSGTMQWVSSVNAGVFGLLLAVLACTGLKRFLMPWRSSSPEVVRDVNEVKNNKKQHVSVGRFHGSSGKRVVWFEPALKTAG